MDINNLLGETGTANEYLSKLTWQIKSILIKTVMENLRKRAANGLESNNQVVSSSEQSMAKETITMIQGGPISLTRNVIAPPLALSHPDNNVRWLTPVSLISGSQDALKIPEEPFNGFNINQLSLPTQSATVSDNINVKKFSGAVTKQNSQDGHLGINIGDVQGALRKRKKLKFMKNVDSSMKNPGRTTTMNRVPAICQIIDKVNPLDFPILNGSTTVKTVGTCEENHENLRNTFTNRSGIATPVAIFPNKHEKVNEMNVLNLTTMMHPSNSFNASSDNTADNLKEQRVMINTEDVSLIVPITVVKSEPDIQVNSEPDIQVNYEPDIQVKVEPDIHMNYEMEVQMNNEPDIQVKDEPDMQGKDGPDIEVKYEPDTTSSIDTNFVGQSYGIHLEPVQEPDSDCQSMSYRATKGASTKQKRGRPVGSGKISQSEKRERKRLSERERSKERIFIGNHIERWNQLRTELNFTFNHQLAGYLLDGYEKWKKSSKQLHVSSAPMPNQRYLTRSISDTSSTDTGEEDEQYEKRKKSSQCLSSATISNHPHIARSLSQQLSSAPNSNHPYMARSISDTSSTDTGEEDEQYEKRKRSSQQLLSAPVPNHHYMTRSISGTSSTDTGEEDERYEKWKKGSQQLSSAPIPNHPYMTRSKSLCLSSAPISSHPNLTRSISGTSSTDTGEEDDHHPFMTKPESDTSSTDTVEEDERCES